MPDYEIKIHLYDVTPKFEKEVFKGLLNIVGTEIDFWIQVMNDTPVDVAERYDRLYQDELLNKDEKEDVPSN